MKTVSYNKLPINYESFDIDNDGACGTGKHGIWGISPDTFEIIGVEGMEPCIGICIYSELAGIRAAFHLAQTDDAYNTLNQYKWPPDSRVIIAGASSSNFVVKAQLAEVLTFFRWRNFTIDGFIPGNKVSGIYVDRDGNWFVLPPKDQN